MNRFLFVFVTQERTTNCQHIANNNKCIFLY